MLVPNQCDKNPKCFIWRRLGTRTRLSSPLDCPYVVRKMKKSCLPLGFYCDPIAWPGSLRCGLLILPTRFVPTDFHIFIGVPACVLLGFREGAHVSFARTEKIQKVQPGVLARLAHTQEDEVFFNSLRCGKTFDGTAEPGERF